MYSETAAVYIGKIILLVLLKDKQNEPKKEMKHFFLILTMTEECKLLYSTITPHKRKGFDYVSLVFFSRYLDIHYRTYRNSFVFSSDVAH